MGVPSFFKWLVKKYPKVVVDAVEGGNDEEMVDTSLPNPNGLEFDNLYLDMNGIIHPCFHPDHPQASPTSFDEVFNSIFEYIDRLFRIVRPRKLLYMAIDGVAPRAKMNQQRSRRYNTAKDAEFAEAEEEKLRKKFEMDGKVVHPKQKSSQVSDSNVITPGTEFMYKLSIALQHYIRNRLNGDPGWKNIKVILSDANVPGEGEHKVMSFIRLQRNQPNYNSNTRHCLYGLDADLVMLALATHEVHFSILREDVLRGEPQQNCIPPVKANLFAVESPLVKSSEFVKNKVSVITGRILSKVPYQFLNIWTLRDYLELDLAIQDPPANIDFERIIDDFIFMCFFVGNDFLPHLPTLEINEGAIDLLMSVYKKEFNEIGGHLIDTHKMKETKNRYIKLKRVERFFQKVSSYEEKIFEKRSKLRKKYLEKMLRKMLEAVNTEDMENLLDDPKYENVSNFKTSKSLSAFKEEVVSLEATGCDIGAVSDVSRNTEEMMEQLKSLLCDRADLFKHGCLSTDKVKLGTPGWKERYYKEKFAAETLNEIENTRKEIVKQYTKGLCWVLQYYFAGVCSWNWYYKFHYGPFVSDLKGLGAVQINFSMGKPFKPFDQLMAVLPPRSAHALPEVYRHLMTSEESNIIDFYPTDFVVDTDGKRFMWQGVTKLPFIEESRLIIATKDLGKELKEDEIKRNAEAIDKIFVRANSDFGIQISSFYNNKNLCGEGRDGMKCPIDSKISGGMNGYLSPCVNDGFSSCNFCSSTKSLEGIEDDVICVLFEGPEYHDHKCNLPEGVDIPAKDITEYDIVNVQLWHEYDGWKPRESNRLMQVRRTHGRREYECRQPKESSRMQVRRTDGQNLERETYKGAGVGWGGGRGKVSLEKLNSCEGTQIRNSNHWWPRNAFVEDRSEGSQQEYSPKVMGRGHVGRMDQFEHSLYARGTCSRAYSGRRGRGRGFYHKANSSPSTEKYVGMQTRNRSYWQARESSMEDRRENYLEFPSPVIGHGCGRRVEHFQPSASCSKWNAGNKSTVPSPASQPSSSRGRWKNELSPPSSAQGSGN